MQGKKRTLQTLPEDPPPVPGLKVVQIQKGDYRKGLVPMQVRLAHFSAKCCMPMTSAVSADVSAYAYSDNVKLGGVPVPLSKHMGHDLHAYALLLSPLLRTA